MMELRGGVGAQGCRRRSAPARMEAEGHLSLSSAPGASE